MTISSILPSPSTHHSTDPAAPLRVFFATHRDGLWHAARLLGGYAAAGAVADLADALNGGHPLSRTSRRRLDDLRDLLTLEHVGDPDHVAMGFFAVLDPSDPVVEDICLLADRFTDALRQMQARDTQPETAGPVQRTAA